MHVVCFNWKNKLILKHKYDTFSFVCTNTILLADTMIWNSILDYHLHRLLPFQEDNFFSLVLEITLSKLWNNIFLISPMTGTCHYIFLYKTECSSYCVKLHYIFYYVRYWYLQGVVKLNKQLRNEIAWIVDGTIISNIYTLQRMIN